LSCVSATKPGTTTALRSQETHSHLMDSSSAQPPE
jgi:hypothetical protein